MKITCLVENISENNNILSEHGLTFLIETNNKKILFDMGQTDSFSINAEKLGIDLSDVDFAVLSHGHYDHGGGLERFLSLKGKAPVYVSRFAFEPHYNGTDKYIGLDTSLQYRERMIFTDGLTALNENILIVNCKDDELLQEIDFGGLNKVVDGRFVPDDFIHEQYLLINENGKRILFSGCSHRGIINICNKFRPDVLVGGFHFSKFSLDEKLIENAIKLDSYETVYYTCHCTGKEQYEFMKAHMKNLNYISSGQTVII